MNEEYIRSIIDGAPTDGDDYEESYDFYLLPNEVTVVCDTDTPIGWEGEVNGIVYTRRIASCIDPLVYRVQTVGGIKNIEQYLITPENASTSCTTGVTTMGQLFQFCKGITDLDISHFDTREVLNMQNMLRDSDFNGEIEDWNVEKVLDMTNMFLNNTTFNRSLNRWYPNSIRPGGLHGIFKNTQLEKKPPVWYRMFNVFGLKEFMDQSGYRPYPKQPQV